jgi:2'-5' RNA ligase
MHLTLRFIGEVDERRYTALREALAAVSSPTFTLSLNGVGQFPPGGAPRVIWAGVQSPPTLTALQRQIEAAVVAQGHRAEDRPFSAHITLARLKTPPHRDSVTQYFKRHTEFRVEAFPINEFILYSSVLAPGGPTYTREAAYPLSS